MVIFGVCSKTLKKMRSRNVVIYSREKHASKSHLPALLLGMVRSNIRSQQKVAVQPIGVP